MHEKTIDSGIIPPPSPAPPPTLSKFQKKIICFLYSKELNTTRNYGITVSDLAKALMKSRDECHEALLGLESMALIQKRPYKLTHIVHIVLREEVNEFLHYALNQFVTNSNFFKTKKRRQDGGNGSSTQTKNYSLSVSIPSNHFSLSTMVDNPIQTLFVKNWGLRESSSSCIEKENALVTVTASATATTATTSKTTSDEVKKKNIYIFWDVLFYPEFINEIKNYYSALEEERGADEFQTYVFAPENQYVGTHCDVERGLFRKIQQPGISDECWAWRKLNERYFVYQYAVRRHAEFALECQMIWIMSRVISSISALCAESYSGIMIVARDQLALSLSEIISKQCKIPVVCVRHGEAIARYYNNGTTSVLTQPQPLETK